MRLLEPGRKRRGKSTAFWLWSLVGVFALILVLVWIFR
jgi:flagellar biogenesis protein FliO